MSRCRADVGGDRRLGAASASRRTAALQRAAGRSAPACRRRAAARFASGSKCQAHGRAGRRAARGRQRPARAERLDRVDRSVGRPRRSPQRTDEPATGSARSGRPAPRRRCPLQLRRMLLQCRRRVQMAEMVVGQVAEVERSAVSAYSGSRIVNRARPTIAASICALVLMLMVSSGRSSRSNSAAPRRARARSPPAGRRSAGHGAGRGQRMRPGVPCPGRRSSMRRAEPVDQRRTNAGSSA